MASDAAPPPVPLLFLVGDTGGGHRSVAAAVAQALDRAYPGKFAPVICDPLLGSLATMRLRWFVGLYGPTVRLTPWLWGLLWRGYNLPRTLRWLRRTLVSPAYASVTAAVAAHAPAVIAAFHPLTVEPAIRARDSNPAAAKLVTVITDLVTAHLAWRETAADLVIVPSAPLRRQCRLDGLREDRCAEIGLAVGAEFTAPPAEPAERHALRRALGLRPAAFLVLVTGGAEGSGRMYRQAKALLKGVGDIDVAVICGRNRLLRRRLARLAARPGGRLKVLGFVDNMADWMRCADLVVGKAGPSMIAEAACCATPLLLTSSLPGQEQGNVDFVVSAGA